MKKYLVVFLFLVAVQAQAQEKFLFRYNASSVVVSGATALYIPNTQAGDYLHTVVVSSCSDVLGTSFIIYDASGTAANQLIPQINTSLSGTDTGACLRTYFYDVHLSSGLTYTKVGGAAVGIYFYRQSKIYSSFSGDHSKQ